VSGLKLQTRETATSDEEGLIRAAAIMADTVVDR
jgi:hypothetical protein